MNVFQSLLVIVEVGFWLIAAYTYSQWEYLKVPLVVFCNYFQCILLVRPLAFWRIMQLTAHRV